MCTYPMTCLAKGPGKSNAKKLRAKTAFRGPYSHPAPALFLGKCKLCRLPLMRLDGMRQGCVSEMYTEAWMPVNFEQLSSQG